MELEQYIGATDLELVHLALEGDSTSFEFLFNRYSNAILNMYKSRNGLTDEDSHDLLQETFLKVYLKLDKYDPAFTFGQWIYSIAKNTFIDFIRKKKDDISLDNPVISKYGVIIPPAFELSPEEKIINKQKRSELDQHMKQMSPGYRKLIELRFFKDYSYEEIALELNIPMGTVKTRIHRAREKLCKSISDSAENIYN